MSIHAVQSENSGMLVRQKEVLNTFLKTLMEKGLYETSVRDLSGSINLQSGGLYYYYDNKDEAVIACAEEAISRLEGTLLEAAVDDLSDIDKLFDNVKTKAEKMAPTMRFLVQVTTTPRYAERIQPALNRLARRYVYYNAMYAEKFGCTKEELAPYFYMCITSITNYMTFGSWAFAEPQVMLVKEAMKALIAKNAAK